LSSKDRTIGELEKKVRIVLQEKQTVEEQLRLLQSGEGTRLGDLQRMVNCHVSTCRFVSYPSFWIKKMFA